MELTKEQKIIHDVVIGRIKDKNITDWITVGGYAGTGKTYLISEIKKTLEKENPKIKIAFVTFTGKASVVLSQKLGYISSNHFCGTIHSLIYKPEFRYNSKLKRMIVTKWVRVNKLDYNLIIIDEASMVSKEILDDLKFYGIEMVAVGDHGQLPPVSNTIFNLMSDPDYRLETIHRQALGNPIIKLSEMARNRKNIPFGVFSPGVVKLPRYDQKTWDIFNSVKWGEDTIALCALNKTRVEINDKIRKNMGFKDEDLYPGERIICLKNNRNSGIFNGQLGMLMLMTYASTDILEVCVQMDGDQELFNGLIYQKVFGQEQYEDIFGMTTEKTRKFQAVLKETEFKSIDFFDWGYCISVHKAQGSQFKRVVLFEERSYWWDQEFYFRWLYTAITRAEEKLMMISYD